MKYFVAALLVLATFAASTAQIGVPNTFTANTRIVSADVNSNFTAIGDAALNRTGGTMTGALTTQGLGPDANNTRDIASTGTRYRDLWLGRNATIGGTLGVTGVVTGGSFSGSGATLTSIPETAITDGTIFPRLAANESITGAWTVSTSQPQFNFNDTGSTANSRFWRMIAASNVWYLQAWNDALSANSNPIALTRTAGSNTISSVAITATSVDVTGRIASASAQPGFLAYNSVTDSCGPACNPVDFDVEVYDTGNNFAADVFTAPVTGIYQLCVTLNLDWGDNGTARIVTSNRSYLIEDNQDSGSGRSVSNTCVLADMDAADTANVYVAAATTTVDVRGSASPYASYFSGRLMP